MSYCASYCACRLHVFPLCADINRVQLLGRVGRDPEQRGDAYPVVFFPLATAHTIRSSNQDERAFSSGKDFSDFLAPKDLQRGMRAFIISAL